MAVQVAELVEAHGGTDLTWTVTQTAAFPLAPIVRRKAAKELAKWLDAAGPAAARLQ